MRILAASLAMVLLSLTTLQAQQSGSIDVPAEARLVLQAKGYGVQIYTCNDVQGGLKWVLKAPEAKLVDASGKQIGSHFAGPAWRLTDGSQVQGELVASKPAPASDAIAWLLLRAKPGTGTGSLKDVRFIRRGETSGGVAPASGCQAAQDAGATVRVPYTATYSFYAATQ